MRKELINFLKTLEYLTILPGDIEYHVDSYLESINSAQRENSNVSDNEKSQKYFCDLKLTWNNCSVWTKTKSSCDTSCEHYKQKYE